MQKKVFLLRHRKMPFPICIERGTAYSSKEDCVLNTVRISSTPQSYFGTTSYRQLDRIKSELKLLLESRRKKEIEFLYVEEYVETGPKSRGTPFFENPPMRTKVVKDPKMEPLIKEIEREMLFELLKR